MSEDNNFLFNQIIQYPDNQNFIFKKVYGTNGVTMHWHNDFEILYILSGEMNVTIENSKYTLTTDDLVIINPKTIHFTQAFDTCHYLILLIQGDYFNQYSVSDSEHLRIHLPIHPNDSVKEEHAKCLKDLIQDMYDSYQQKSLIENLHFQSLFFQFFHIAADHFSDTAPLPASKRKLHNFAHLDAVISYTLKNYNRRISINEIAEVCGFQREYFCRFFQKNMGCSYLEYLNQIRIYKIYYDMLHSDIPLTVLLEKHGFTNYKLFLKKFHEIYRDTPQNIRKRSSKENPPSHVSKA